MPAEVRVCAITWRVDVLGGAFPGWIVFKVFIPEKLDLSQTVGIISFRAIWNSSFKHIEILSMAAKWRKFSVATKDVEEALEFVLLILEHTRRLAKGLKETVEQREYDSITLKRDGALFKYIIKNSVYHISDMGLQSWCAKTD